MLGSLLKEQLLILCMEAVNFEVTYSIGSKMIVFLFSYKIMIHM